VRRIKCVNSHEGERSKICDGVTAQFREDYTYINSLFQARVGKLKVMPDNRAIMDLDRARQKTHRSNQIEKENGEIEGERKVKRAAFANLTGRVTSRGKVFSLAQKKNKEGFRNAESKCRRSRGLPGQIGRPERTWRAWIIEIEKNLGGTLDFLIGLGRESI